MQGVPQAHGTPLALHAAEMKGMGVTWSASKDARGQHTCPLAADTAWGTDPQGPRPRTTHHLLLSSQQADAMFFFFSFLNG